MERTNLRLIEVCRLITNWFQGFVSSVNGKNRQQIHSVCDGKVRHSQTMNDPFVTLWIITERNGTVLFALCVGCMAGEWECCSHIGSVLFLIEA